MYCPNCSALCNEEDHFCYLCGTALHQETAVQPKKGSRWIPLLLLILMSAAGLLLFFATAGNTAPIRADGSAEWFYVQDNVLYFEESRYTGGSELSVPGELAGQPVYALSEDCFAGCDWLTTVILPDTLTSIGDGAFYGCTALRGIYIPQRVKLIGTEAFYGCTALEAICLHDSLKDIGNHAFDGCNYLGYIFFLGDYDSWSALYSEFINPYVGVFCEDGSFYQGGEVYE